MGLGFTWRSSSASIAPYIPIDSARIYFRTVALRCIIQSIVTKHFLHVVHLTENGIPGLYNSVYRKVSLCLELPM